MTAAAEASPPWMVVTTLGITQTVAWASSYYLPAVLAAPMAHDLGLATSAVFAAFSTALVISALAGPRAGAAIDRFGGRPVLMVTNLVFALGLVVMAAAQDAVTLFAAWMLMGVGMSGGLYDAAFSALVWLYGPRSRGAISGVTLLAGFASTVGWPLTAVLESHFGWRGACLAWAALHLLIGLPLNAALPRRRGPVAAAEPEAARSSPPVQSPRRSAALLAFVFAATWFTSTGMAAHLPRVLEAAGVSVAAAIAMGALVGPAQVGGRLLEIGVLRRFHPFLSARLAAVLHPAGAVALIVLGAPAAAVFAVLHGMGNGILTIANGTLPLVIFGAAGYGQRQSRLTQPSRILQALSPWLFGLCLDRWGSDALLLTTTLLLSSLMALMLLPRPRSHL